MRLTLQQRHAETMIDDYVDYCRIEGEGKLEFEPEGLNRDVLVHQAVGAGCYLVVVDCSYMPDNLSIILTAWIEDDGKIRWMMDEVDGINERRR